MRSAGVMRLLCRTLVIMQTKIIGAGVINVRLVAIDGQDTKYLRLSFIVCAVRIVVRGGQYEAVWRAIMENEERKKIVVPICRRCHRRLKTPEAIERGMGKTCWEKSKNIREAEFLKRVRLFEIREIENGGDWL